MTEREKKLALWKEQALNADWDKFFPTDIYWLIEELTKEMERSKKLDTDKRNNAKLWQDARDDLRREQKQTRNLAQALDLALYYVNGDATWEALVERVETILGFKISKLKALASYDQSCARPSKSGASLLGRRNNDVQNIPSFSPLRCGLRNHHIGKGLQIVQSKKWSVDSWGRLVCLC